MLGSVGVGDRRLRTFKLKFVETTRSWYWIDGPMDRQMSERMKEPFWSARTRSSFSIGLMWKLYLGFVSHRLERQGDRL